MLADGQITAEAFALLQAALAVPVAPSAAGAVQVGGTNSGPITTTVTTTIDTHIHLAQVVGASEQALRNGYLAKLMKASGHLPLGVGDGKTSVQLAAVYTGLLTLQAADAEMERKAHSGKPRTAVEQVDAQARLVLLGGPGSGKSTFVNYLAMAMAGELLGGEAPNLASLLAPLQTDPDSRESATKRQQWRHGALLPVVVVLRDLASGSMPPSGTAGTAQTIWAHVCKKLAQDSLASYAPYLQKHLLETGALLLFDGLDEVPEASRRREQIKQAVQDFATVYARCRVVVTSRTYAYSNEGWQLGGFESVHLQPFSRGQIEAFVNAWYVHMAGLALLSEAVANARALQLNNDIARNKRLHELATRPLLLTLMVRLQTRNSGPLPERRERLYADAVEMLLDDWERLKPRVNADGTGVNEPSLTEWLNASRDNIRKQLNRLAFEAHRDQPKGEVDSADIAQAQLVAALLNASDNRGEVKVGQLENYLRDRAGILAAHGGAMYRFPHRTFQEYLAACHLTNDGFPVKVAQLARTEPTRWREALLLAGARAASGSGSNAWLLAAQLCPAAVQPGQGPAAEHWGALLAGLVLAESADLQDLSDVYKPTLEHVRRWQVALLSSPELPALERVLAGRSLASLGDPRPEVMTLAGMQFCAVPAGRFTMGSSDAHDDEKPTHEVDIPYLYYMARYPVTVAQWREYVQLFPQASADPRSSLGEGNRPVVHVSLQDAYGFCQAISQHWRGQLPKGFQVALPSEAEWEKAARGGTHIAATVQHVPLPALVNQAPVSLVANKQPTRPYPWSQRGPVAELANLAGAMGGLSTAGCFAGGASPYGCEDMSGNVWEWTRSELKGYPYSKACEHDHAPSQGKMVVRGGSWIYSADDARCAFRSDSHPAFRYYGLGLRVVLRSSPVS